jgi:hypothetical protein
LGNKIFQHRAFEDEYKKQKLYLTLLLLMYTAADEKTTGKKASTYFAKLSGCV